MGGTFDPIHFGHLVAAEEARLRFQLQRIVFVPNGSPPHKKDYEVSAAEARYDMVVLATATNPAFEVSRVEIERPGPSYAVDTVEFFRGQVGPGALLYFITGADAMLELLTWREPERLAELCEFIAVVRPGHDVHRLAEVLGSRLMSRTRVLQVPGVDISSTEVRRRAAAGETLRYLTPWPVAHYIETRRLYADEGEHSGSDAGTSLTRSGKRASMRAAR